MSENITLPTPDLISPIRADYYPPVSPTQSVIPTVVEGSHKEKIWKIFFWLVVSMGIIAFLYFFVATPHSVIGSPLPVFGNSKYVLGEKISYLIWEPNKGDIIIFDQDSTSRIGILNYWSGPENNVQYEVISTPNQKNPYRINRSQIKEKIYYPTRYGLSSLPKLAPASSPSSSPAQTLTNNTVNPSTGWKISNHPDQGFSFEYPIDWTVQSNYSIQSSDAAITLWIENLDPERHCLEFKNSKNIRLGSISTASAEYYSGTSSQDLCQVSGQKYILVNQAKFNFAMIYSEANIVEAENIFAQIIKTFKFIDNINTNSTWDSYSNSEYGFSVKYPHDLLLSTSLDSANEGAYHFGNILSIFVGHRRDEILQMIDQNHKEHQVYQPTELPKIMIGNKSFAINKYVFGDGGPADVENCFAASLAITYYSDIESKYLILINTQKSEKTCDNKIIEDVSNFDDVMPITQQILSTFKFTDQTTSPVVVSPKAGAVVKTPLVITGSVTPGWMFEGQFPVEIRDSNNKVVGNGVAQEVEPGSWTSGKSVEFTATVEFASSDKSGFIVLLSDNPSGIPDKQLTYQLPINF